MNQIVKSIVIDVAKKNKIQKIIAKQKDNKTRFVNATITNEGKQIIVNSNAIVCVNGLREDGERKSFQGEVNENGTVTVPITYWMLELEGLVECDISIMGVDEEMLTTTSFKISVEKPHALMMKFQKIMTMRSAFVCGLRRRIFKRLGIRCRLNMKSLLERLSHKVEIIFFYKNAGEYFA